MKRPTISLSRGEKKQKDETKSEFIESIYRVLDKKISGKSLATLKVLNPFTMTGGLVS